MDTKGKPDDGKQPVVQNLKPKGSGFTDVTVLIFFININTNRKSLTLSFKGLTLRLTFLHVIVIKINKRNFMLLISCNFQYVNRGII